MWSHPESQTVVFEPVAMKSGPVQRDVIQTETAVFSSSQLAQEGNVQDHNVLLNRHNYINMGTSQNSPASTNT